MATLEAELETLRREKDSLAHRNLELEANSVKGCNEALNNCARPLFDGHLYVSSLPLLANSLLAVTYV